MIHAGVLVWIEDMVALRDELIAARDACKEAKQAAEDAKLTPQREFLLGKDAQMMLPPGWMMMIEMGQGLNEFYTVDGDERHRSSSPGWGRVQTITTAGGF